MKRIKSGYIKDMRRRDAVLVKGWMQIATSLSIETASGVQMVEKHEFGGSWTEDFLKESARWSPLLMVFHDAGFKDDRVIINVEQISKLISPYTGVKTI